MHSGQGKGRTKQINWMKMSRSKEKHTKEKKDQVEKDPDMGKQHNRETDSR